MIKVEFDCLAVDLKTGDHVMLIKRTDNSKIIPIWIGSYEAFSIALALTGVKPPRPLTHDLTLDIIEAMGGKVTSIVISGIKENTYYALLHIERGDVENYVIDARPSDSTAIALRAKCPIFASKDIGSFDLENPTDELEKEFADRLRKIKPEELIGF
ncbi:bifunctional nuclease family protein [bacterium]|nr:bifunctional nuclease family protein [bacterium]